MIDEYYTWLIFGYHSDELKPHSSKFVVSVCDGCYMYRVQSLNQYRDLCISCSHKIEYLSDDTRHSFSESRLQIKEPLPYGWQSKLSDITDNKSSSVYLGSIAEVILSNIYTNVQVMPNGNHGFDIICNRNFKIDIKSSATGDKGHWVFAINKNQIADYFLCIAFNNRDDLYNPAHLWMIPGHKINHLTAISIYKTTINKWNEYELSLDKLVACCDNAKER